MIHIFSEAYKFTFRVKCDALNDFVMNTDGFLNHMSLNNQIQFIIQTFSKFIQ